MTIISDYSIIRYKVENSRCGRCTKMLNIYYGNMPEAIFNTSVYFKNVYEDEWITDRKSVV